MSRISRTPVKISPGVTCSLKEKDIFVKGPKGQLQMTIPSGMRVEIASEGVWVHQVGEESPKGSAMSGTLCRLIGNMVVGVSEGFEKNIELIGVGYRAEMQGSTLKLSLGFSHDILYPVPQGISIQIEKPTAFKIVGMDKQKVGQVAAELRRWRPPEPYKGKGVHRKGEFVRRKEGKSK